MTVSVTRVVRDATTVDDLGRRTITITYHNQRGRDKALSILTHAHARVLERNVNGRPTS